MSDKKLQIIPLGGLGEFGMNSMAIRYGDDIIVLDAGMMFPDAELLGVDIVTPDFTYLEQNREHVRGLILTHGHEDHIGGVPFLLAQINIPVYGTAFTLALVERRLEEHEMLDDAKLNKVKPGDKLELGPVLASSSSTSRIPSCSCVALAITTPLGVIIHTGDFKVDPTPTDNELFDLHTFAEYGKRGVLLLMSDSTNVDRPGYTESERAVGPRLEDLFVALAAPPGDLLLQLLHSPPAADPRSRARIRPQSGVPRPQHDQHHRDRARSRPARPFPTAFCCGRRTSCRPRPARWWRSSPARRASRCRRCRASPSTITSIFPIEPGDTVALSARIIPGNEKAIYRMINHLARRGADVVYGTMNPPIHVSGHGSAEELRLVLNLVRPRYLRPDPRRIPADGQARRSWRQHLQPLGPGRIRSCSKPARRWRSTATARAKASRLPVGRVCIDSGTIDEVVEDMVIRDRRHLSEDGFVLPIIAINKHTGRAEGAAGNRQPRLHVDGGRLGAAAGSAASGAEDAESSTAEERGDWGVMQEKIRADLKRFLTKQTSRRPLIMPVILEV